MVGDMIGLVIVFPSFGPHWLRSRWFHNLSAFPTKARESVRVGPEMKSRQSDPAGRQTPNITPVSISFSIFFSI